MKRKANDFSKRTPRGERTRQKLTRKKKLLLTLTTLLVLFLGGIAIGARKVYVELQATADSAYQPVVRENRPLVAPDDAQKAAEAVVPLDLAQAQPFSVLLLGIDTGDLGRTEAGRSDTMIVATVNPTRKQTTLVSLERDTQVELIGCGTRDKLNAAFAYGGPAMAMDTVENLLQVPIHHYLTIDLAGLQKLVDALGGITVNNQLAFTFEGSTFPVGDNQLDGVRALQYTRMRYEDPDGNYGRQRRQLQVIEGLTKKLVSLDGLTSYQSILAAVASHIATDLSFENMKAITSNYRHSFETIVQDQVLGEGFMENGISYQQVSASEVARVQQVLWEQLGE